MTGANGFVGTAVRVAAAHRSHEVVAAVRHPVPEMAGEVHVVGEIDGRTEWTGTLAGVDAVIHLAARVHVMRDEAADPLAAFREVNVSGTRRLGEACVTAGVRRLVYVSSIKVNGERTTGRAFTESDPAAPEDDYGRSKFEAEESLRELAAGAGIEVVIVRPPLIYGPAVRGNLLRLLGLVRRGVPLPFGRIANGRSLVGVENLADLLVLAATHPDAAGELLLGAESPPLSTRCLIGLLAEGLGVPARLFPVPGGLLRMVGRVPGLGGSLARLTESLEVDASRAMRILGWRPTRSTGDGLRAMAAWYRTRAP